MQHFEQAFFASLFLLFSISLNTKQGYNLAVSTKFCLYLFCGVIIGKLLLYSIIYIYSIEVNSGRIYYFTKNYKKIINEFIFNFQYILWSIMGICWFIILKFTYLGRKIIPFFIALIGVCLLTVIVYDQTRVAAIVSFPLIFIYVLLNIDILKKISHREITTLFISWVLMPYHWVWDGIPRKSIFQYDIIYILHKLFGAFTLPESPALWPFNY